MSPLGPLSCERNAAGRDAQCPRGLLAGLPVLVSRPQLGLCGIGSPAAGLALSPDEALKMQDFTDANSSNEVLGGVDGGVSRSAGDITAGQDSAAIDLEPNALELSFDAEADGSEEEPDVTPAEQDSATIDLDPNIADLSFDAVADKNEEEPGVAPVADSTAGVIEPSALPTTCDAPVDEGEAEPVPDDSLHEALGESSLSFNFAVLEAFRRMATDSEFNVAKAWRSLGASQISDRRDLFPLPRATLDMVPAQVPEAEQPFVLEMVDLTLAGLNCLDAAGDCAPFAADRVRGPSATQRAAITHVIQRTLTMHMRLAEAGRDLDTCPARALGSFEPSQAEPAP